MSEETKWDQVYFAASNTGAGFVNYFDRIFLQDERVYILKGGPGTGKSYFLRQVAKMAQQRGLDCEKYLCSSDADSLDGVRIPSLGISVFDGTSPHAADPKLPGAKDEIINLGVFWDGEKLRQRKEEIQKLSEQKTDAYASALSMLNLAAECMRYRLTLLTPYLKREKMERAASRFLGRMKTVQGSALPRPIRTYGMKGERYLPTLRQRARTVLVMAPLYGIEYLYLQLILQRAMAAGLAVEYSPHPLLPELPEALYFPGNQTLICATEPQGQKTVGTRRFLDSAVLSKKGKLLRFLGKGMETMTEAALEEFGEMKTHHFALEHIYEGAMDFGAKEAFTRHFLRSLFEDEKN